MRAVVQRVSRASVSVDDKVTGSIGFGMVILLGVSSTDTDELAAKLADKIYNLRFFNDANEKMNLSCTDVGGEILVISQFTLFGDCRKGRRPSYTDAAAPQLAAARELIPAGGAADEDEKRKWGIRAKICVTDWNEDGLDDILMGDCGARFMVDSSQLKKERTVPADKVINVGEAAADNTEEQK